MLQRLLLAGILLTLGACGEVTLSLPPYTPTTTDELSGSVTVQDFTYSPKPGVKQNEIRETAAGRILLTEPVGVYYANAVRREFRQAGLSLRDGSCLLNGQVRDFAIDSLGFSSDYITDVQYTITGPNGQMLYDKGVQVKFNTSKFLAAQIVMANINKMVSDNIQKMMTDAQFVDLLKGACAIPKTERRRS